MRKVHKISNRIVKWPMGGFHLTECGKDSDFVERTEDNKKVTCKRCLKIMEKK